MKRRKKTEQRCFRPRLRRPLSSLSASYSSLSSQLSPDSQRAPRRRPAPCGSRRRPCRWRPRRRGGLRRAGRRRRRKRKRRKLPAKELKTAPLVPRHCCCCSSAATEEEGGRQGLPPRGPEVLKERKEKQREVRKRSTLHQPQKKTFPWLFSNCSPGASPLGARIREGDRDVLDAAQRDEPIDERLERERTARTKETWLQ